jgi:hypothetical protein
MTRETDFDETLRIFLDEKAEQGAGTAPSLEVAVGRLAPHLGRRGGGSTTLLVVAATAALLVAMVGSAIAIGSGWLRLPAVEPPILASLEPTSPTEVSNGWIAYSSSAGDSEEQQASDIFIVREGGEAIRIASSEGATLNECPMFSPDGTKLAYGRRTFGTFMEPHHAIVIVEIQPDGSLTDVTHLEIPTGLLLRHQAPCPQWSADGSRLGYLDLQRELAMSLDGSTLEPSGDPAAADFARFPNGPLLSPDGEWVATLRGCTIVLTATERVEPREIRAVGCPYALATWAPDSSGILYMDDVSGRDYALRMAFVDPARHEVTLDPRVLVDNSGTGSWPGNGDVSWQPVYR